MLSIIILTCNQRDFTMRLLESMRDWLLSAAPGRKGAGEDDDEHVEVVVVDNGSSDSTCREVKEWVRRHAIGNLQLVEAGSNLGVARGRNLGLRHAKGDLLMLLDNDTIASPATFRAMMRHLRSNPQCGLVAPALYSPSGELQASAKPYPGLWIKLAHVLRPGRELKCERTELSKPHPYYVIGACQMFRREVLNLVGMLDESIFFGPEDCDFCIRIRKAGLTVDYRSDLRLTHDWQRATRRLPFGWLGRRHAAALLRFYLRHPLP